MEILPSEATDIHKHMAADTVVFLQLPPPAAPWWNCLSAVAEAVTCPTEGQPTHNCQRAVARALRLSSLFERCSDSAQRSQDSGDQGQQPARAIDQEANDFLILCAILHAIVVEEPGEILAAAHCVFTIASSGGQSYFRPCSQRVRVCGVPSIFAKPPFPSFRLVASCPSSVCSFISSTSNHQAQAPSSIDTQRQLIKHALQLAQRVIILSY